MESTLTQMDSCFELLFPRLDGPDLYQSEPMAHYNPAVDVSQPPGLGDKGDSDRMTESCSSDDSDTDSDSGNDSDSDSEWVDVPDDTQSVPVEGEGQSGSSPSGGLQTHGIPTPSYTVTVELPKSGRVVIEMAEDNRAILSTLCDCERILRSSLLPACNRTIEVSGREGLLGGGGWGAGGWENGVMCDVTLVPTEPDQTGGGSRGPETGSGAPLASAGSPAEVQGAQDSGRTGVS